MEKEVVTHTNVLAWEIPCRYLINSIRAADSDEIVLTFKSPTQSVTVSPREKKEDEDFFYMVQPVRMNE